MARAAATGEGESARSTLPSLSLSLLSEGEEWVRLRLRAGNTRGLDAANPDMADDDDDGNNGDNGDDGAVWLHKDNLRQAPVRLQWIRPKLECIHNCRTTTNAHHSVLVQSYAIVIELSLQFGFR